MSAHAQPTWDQFQNGYRAFPDLDLSLDLCRSGLTPEFLARMQMPMEQAFVAMNALETGAIANPDEKRMVGHYWLRAPELAPTPAIRDQIQTMLREVKAFVTSVHAGRITGSGGVFQQVLVIGIGGSALGPQFVAHALGSPRADRLRVSFLDNTDPDGMDRVFAQLSGQLGRTLCVVISKSGGTKETRNGMLEAQRAYDRAGLRFPAHAVAVTGENSELDTVAARDGWLRRFPMWDWVGGRTSVTSAVGLLPAGLQGLDVDNFLAGAAVCDRQTRRTSWQENPAALLALCWFCIGNGLGQKAMVVLPYKDRLELFSKYLQQLIMESLGKELDLRGKRVNQGLTVYGNKGSTDQHAYVQQLRDGLDNFFVTFVEVLLEREGESIEVEPGTTSGDYLSGFLLGTKQALYESGRHSITITAGRLSAFTVGVLIALFERAVGLYANLIGVNAYHQPGVEAGKKAAEGVIRLSREVVSRLRQEASKEFSVQDLAVAIGKPTEAELVFRVCQHLAANGRIQANTNSGVPNAARYRHA